MGCPRYIRNALRGSPQRFQGQITAAIGAKDDQFARDLKDKDVRIAEATKAASDATASQQQAEIELAQVGIELAKQQEETAVAVRERMEIQERIKHRTLSMEQRTRLVEALKRGPKATVNVSCVVGDTEGKDFAREILRVLRACGWPAGGVTQVVDTGDNPVGVGIWVRDADALPPHAATLRAAFRSVGILLTEKEDAAAVRQGTLLIFVGTKP